ncbi:threonine ammonia-lyase, biosynthetic [Pelistega sp. NLN82]|uniref:L-threonine dehydratase n=1 Tax=Pelistega ratti TaxID=2652177 RepID=A0A6L9Y505_9BURK|nr:threonine ammonia-lyase, biosynthetic [Pelistega ratti]NEN74884.1 threonine ammonia-lyase, biosynthetic [Pelistega ratti]
MDETYLKKILTAKVYEVAQETSLDYAKLLSARLNNDIYLKREDKQQVFSFKIRGAYNKMAHLSRKELDRGVIAASAGNHAQGVAFSAKKLGCRAVIVMPISTPQVKIDAVKRLGGEVVLAGTSYTDAYNHAIELEKKEKLTFVHPFDDPYVIAGQGTVAMEILRQANKKPDAIFCAIGGGGLIAGVAAYIKALDPSIRIIGVQTEDSCAMIKSVKSNRRITLNDVGLFSDGTAVKQVGVETFKLCKTLVDDYITVNTDEICAALRDVFQDTRNILEPAGALSVAGAKKYAQQHHWEGKQLIAVTSGANMNFDRLRYVAERAEVGENKEVIFSVTMPEIKGSFKQLLASLDNRAVTEFNYRISNESLAHVFVGVQISHPDEADKIRKQIEKRKFTVYNLTNDDLAKTHLRYMVGGKSDLAVHEVLYRFEFPERPGALSLFLNSMSPEWNISLFHYRNMGGDFGHVLVGMQVPPSDKQAFKDFLNNLGYPYINESNNPAYRLFL